MNVIFLISVSFVFTVLVIIPFLYTVLSARCLQEEIYLKEMWCARMLFNVLHQDTRKFIAWRFLTLQFESICFRKASSYDSNCNKRSYFLFTLCNFPEIIQVCAMFYFLRTYIYCRKTKSGAQTNAREPQAYIPVQCLHGF